MLQTAKDTRMVPRPVSVSVGLMNRHAYVTVSCLQGLVQQVKQLLGAALITDSALWPAFQSAGRRGVYGAIALQG